VVTEYRVRLAREDLRREDAERLQSVCVEWDRKRAAEGDQNSIRSLAVSLHELAQIQRERGSASCVDGYQDALGLAEKIHDTQLAAICAFNLGHAFEDLDQIRDLDAAGQWYHRSLDLHAKDDRMGRAGCLAQLGSVSYGRFQAARDADKPASTFLREAGQYYEQALAMFPANDVADLAATHNQLGNVYDDAGQLDAALDHYRSSIRYKETMRDRLAAGQTRYNAAITLARAGRFADARE
jgi:tetratricopeptide (TPR) repeat protein